MITMIRFSNNMARKNLFKGLILRALRARKINPLNRFLSRRGLSGD
jgi:hypothetical protein